MEDFAFKSCGETSDFPRFEPKKCHFCFNLATKTLIKTKVKVQTETVKIRKCDCSVFFEKQTKCDNCDVKLIRDRSPFQLPSTQAARRCSTLVACVSSIQQSEKMAKYKLQSMQLCLQVISTKVSKVIYMLNLIFKLEKYLHYQRFT